MAKSVRDVVVIGGSAGALSALIKVTETLPPGFPAAIFVVIHLMADRTSVLPEIVARDSALHAAHAKDGEPIERSRIYVCPPDRHLLMAGGHVRLVRGPRENGHRPAIDPLFRSAARSYGGRVAAVILSGTLDDGSEGLAVVKKRGGYTLVQDPADAVFPEMPRNAMLASEVDEVLPATKLGPALVKLMSNDAEDEGSSPKARGKKRPKGTKSRVRQPGTGRPIDTTQFSCPDCKGPMHDTLDQGLLRYRCRVGHVFSPESLLDQKTDELESALWVALRTLEENADLAARMADRAESRGHGHAARRFLRRAEESEEHARIVREQLLRLDEPARDVATRKRPADPADGAEDREAAG